eukprot:10117830-Ditylum_brightwellii.AAC.1
MQQSSTNTKTSNSARATSVLGAMAVCTLLVQLEMLKQMSSGASSVHQSQQLGLIPNLQQTRRH